MYKTTCLLSIWPDCTFKNRIDEYLLMVLSRVMVIMFMMSQYSKGGVIPYSIYAQSVSVTTSNY